MFAVQSPKAGYCSFLQGLFSKTKTEEKNFSFFFWVGGGWDGSRREEERRRLILLQQTGPVNENFIFH